MNFALRQSFSLQEMAANERQTLLTTYIQEQVAKIAGIEFVQVDIQQPLNYLGFDSLMADELRNQLLAELEADIPLLTILEDSSVASLVERVQEQLANAKSLASDSSQHLTALSSEQPEGGRYPLSQGQWGLWFLYRLAPESAAYNVAFTARIRSSVNVAALRKACQALIDRHPTLRTTYGQEDVPFQEIHASQPLDFEQIDASTWDWQTLTERAIAAYQRPFNLESGPVLRMTLLTQTPQEHVLLLTIHHIAVDGMSFGILLDELQLLYQAESTEQAVSLPATDYQYTDFVQWQRELVQDAIGEQLWTYWQQRLAGVSTLILPTDRPRPLTQSYRGVSYSFEISEALTAQLRTLAKAEGATLYMTLLAAFQILLYRYTGQEDIVVGTPASGRSQTDAKTVGFFVNMIALRTNLAGNPTFTELLAQVRQTVLEALAHQSYPAPLLIERLGMNRDLSQPGLFRASFNLLNLSKMANDFELSVSSRVGSRAQWGELVLEPFEIPQQEGQNDFVFDVMETMERLIGIFRYSTDLFEATTIHRMADHFRTLLEGIVANPHQPIAQLPFLTPTEQQLLMEWGSKTANYPRNLCIHQLIETQVERTSNAISVVGDRQSLTYSQLNAQANQLARYLQVRGVAPEVRVGICLERSPSLLAAVLGVLKAGGAYVPLDPNYPPDRLSFMLTDAQAALLLTDSTLLETLPATDVPSICLDRQWAAIAQESDTNLTSPVQPENLAYIVYTSGSTGKAKGVMIEHRSLVNAYFAWEEAYQLPALASHLQMASFSFDVFAGDFVRALGSGAKLVLCPQDWLLEPELLYSLMQEQAIDAAEFGPAVLRNLMQYLRSSGQRLDFMRLLVVGSDAFYVQEYQQLQQLCDRQTRIVNSYGVSEATIDSSYFETTTLNLSNEGMVPIGCPFGNTQLVVLDAHLQLVPVGVVGELYIGGAGLARGYVNQPELTEERFIDVEPILDWRTHNPPSTLRLYKTGDLVRYLSDGNLEYLGRSDRQIKLRGFRIELGEIESILTQHPAVWQSVVTVREDALGMKSLVAYVVPEPQELVMADLRTFLKQKLPEPMLLSGFVVLDALPLNANGKVDRRALPMPDVFQRGIDVGFVAPRNSIERRIADIWMSILKLDRVGVHDNFFELGGHSLLATQAIAQLRQAFSIELPLLSLFKSPTIAQLGELIESSFHQRQVLAVSAIEPTPYTEELPLSFAQESLWFLDQLEGIGSTYNMPMPLRFTGTLNVAALEQSLTALVQRHAILRTNFLVRDAQPSQVIAANSSLLPIFSLKDLPHAEQESQLQQLIAEDVRKPFNLAVDLLLRATLLQLGETEHVLLISLHHIVADGWSIDIFARELGILYTAFLNHQPSPLPELPIQYADFALWQRRYLQEVLESLLAHWQRTLSGAPPVLSLPTDYPRPAVQTFHGKSTSFQLNAQLTEALKSLSQQSKVTLFMTLLAAFKVLLRGYTGQDDIVVGTPIANRNRAETAGLIGYFVNILVLRTDLSGNPSWREVLARVYQVAIDAYTYQDLPFEKLVESLQPQRSLGHSPLFQVMFVLQNAPTPELHLPDLTVRGVDVEIVTSKFDLTLAMRETPQGLQGFVEYNTDLFKPETIARLMEHYQILLQAIATNPEQRLKEVSLLTAGERKQLLFEWNDTDTNYLSDRCIHQLFEAQVERTPNAIAVVFGEQRLTYRALNERANQLAHTLLSQGVVPEVRVGICLDRSVEMIVAVLGVLKAGGAYLPLDPNYPRDRLSFMLADTQASFLLIQQNLIDLLPDLGIPTLCLDRDWQTIAQASAANPVSPTTPLNLAYIVYTSGSTGKAKGVMIEHRSLVNAYFAWNDAYHLPSLSSHLQMASFSFDVFAGDWVRSLCSGAKLVLCPHEWLLEPELLYSLMQEQEVDTAEFSPAVLRHLMQYLHRTEQTLELFKLLVVGSDSFYLKEYQDLRQLCASDTRIIHSYGVSEATIDSTYFETTEVNLSLDRFLPIGRPFANTQIYLLNPDLQLVPIGVAGELYIGGAGLARGYLNRPELTKERFIEHPSNTQARLYKTGDLARYNDGTLELIGRCDEQVKLRGFRIEVGEIEAVLTQHPQVREAAVVLRTDQTGDKQLVAYVVPRNRFNTTKEPLSITTLRSFLKTELPSYMVPAIFVVLEAMPLSPNGKIDRRALPVPASTRPELEDSFVPPTTAIETTLAEIWADILKLSRIGVNDNFFDLGGHSLLATSLVFRIRQAFAIDFPLRYLFEAPTIAALSTAIEQLTTDPTSDRSSEMLSFSTVVSRLQRNLETPVPLSLSQQYIWHMHQSDNTGAGLNSSLLVRFRGSLSPEVVEQSFNEIIRRHEILRTVFVIIEDRPMQVVLPSLHLSLIFEDLQHLPPEARESEAIRLGLDVGQRPFNLTSAPPIRAALFRLTPKEHWLLMTMHHIITDGWSFSLLLQELDALIRVSSGLSEPLPDVSCQYADFALWQQQVYNEVAIAQQLAYWRRKLVDSGSQLYSASGLTLYSKQANHYFIRLSEPIVAAIEALGRSQKVTSFVILLAALKLALAKWSGQREILVVATIGNRTVPETERMLGCFINDVILRTQILPEQTGLTLIQQLQETVNEAIDHKDVPLQQVIEQTKRLRALNLMASITMTSSVQATEELRGWEAIELQTKREQWGDIATELYDETTPLELYIEVSKTIRISVNYSIETFTAETIDRLFANYQDILTQLVNQP